MKPGCIKRIVGLVKVQLRAKSGVAEQNQKQLSQKMSHCVKQESEQPGGLEPTAGDQGEGIPDPQEGCSCVQRKLGENGLPVEGASRCARAHAHARTAAPPPWKKSGKSNVE